ncbi:unnamed protein product [marine sediment metagenome]|uniref:Uncharacterized protein n=1 Tax=marine sediment metagenome TaxID=412755 RepID=X0S618_9ZZZZ
MTLPDSRTIRDYGLLLAGAIAALALVYLAGTWGPAPTVWQGYAVANEKVVAFRELQLQELQAQCQTEMDQLRVQLATLQEEQEEPK